MMGPPGAPGQSAQPAQSLQSQSQATWGWCHWLWLPTPVAPWQAPTEQASSWLIHIE